MDLASTNFIVTLIIGGVVGWLASILMKTNAQMGILANVTVGVVGRSGLFVANALGVRAHTTPAAWIVAILGAALLVDYQALGVFDRLARVPLAAVAHARAFDAGAPPARIGRRSSIRLTEMRVTT